MKKILFLSIICCFLLIIYFYRTNSPEEPERESEIISENVDNTIKPTSSVQNQGPLSRKMPHRSFAPGGKQLTAKALPPKMKPAMSAPASGNARGRQLPGPRVSYQSPFEVAEGYVIVQGDLLVKKQEELTEEEITKGETTFGEAKLWPTNHIPIAFEEHPQKLLVQEALDHFHSQSHVRFIKRENQVDFIHVVAGSGCYSFAGFIGGRQELIVGPGCSLGNIMHELLHALGLFHEQSHPERDQYIQVLWQNIKKTKLTQFAKLDKDFWPSDLPFDFDSILLYPSNAFAKQPGSYTLVTIEGEPFSSQRQYLSSSDVEKIALLYPE